MEGTLTAPSKPRCADSPKTRESLISEWVAKLAINAGASLDAKTQAVYKNLWVEGLADLPTDALQVAFQKTLKECTYWPVKVADIRKHVTRAESNVTSLDAEYAWQQVFEIRRLYWNPDIPDDHSRRLALLPERTQQAARAAGIFRDFESIQDLHVWAKKRFVESFIASAELEQDQFLLPDGELKGLLAGFAATKALPASEGYDAMRERGLAYTAQLKISPSDVSSRCQADPPRPLAKPTQPTRSIEEQKRILRERGFEI